MCRREGSENGGPGTVYRFPPLQKGVDYVAYGRIFNYYEVTDLFTNRTPREIQLLLITI